MPKKFNKFEDNFLVLVPHRDTRGCLQKYCDRLLRNGLKGVYNFPSAVPIARLSQPLTCEELKQIARSLREAAGGNKFYTTGVSSVSFGDLELLGFRLNLDISLIFTHRHGEYSKMTHFPNPSILGCFLSPPNSEQQLCNFRNLCTSVPPHENFPLPFRAAAIANMRWQTVQKDNEVYYKWQIDKLFWLPKYKLLVVDRPSPNPLPKGLTKSENM